MLAPCIRNWATGAMLVIAALGATGASHAQSDGTLQMTGDIGDFSPGVVDDPVHDPAIVQGGDAHYVFSTGILRNPQNPGGIFARRSSGTLAGPWQSLGEIPVPEWTRAYNHNHLWAPDAVRRDDTFYLYYSASTFGRNTSAIGVASTNTPSDVESWLDHGPVIETVQGVHDYNAIDPFVFEAEGEWWIAFGSHWSGVKLQKLASMTETSGEVIALADRRSPPNAVESPAIFKHGDYYYLLVSWDRCCAGVNSTYKIAVGRSAALAGPYVDRDGIPLMSGGGTVILAGDGDQIGTGGQDVLVEDGAVHVIHHYYDRSANGVIRMQIRKLEWEDGWPYFELN